MGIDSGLPSFRGGQGFWNKALPYDQLTSKSIEVADPSIFLRDPEAAWGFYGSRLRLYRSTEPHPGFQILRKWAEGKESYFVYTSNVDGHFQKAGFDPARVFEIHGSIYLAECITPCSKNIWSIEDIDVTVDESTLRARPPLPACPRCGKVARPNVILFGDETSVTTNRWQQSRRHFNWEQSVMGPALAIVELGAGIAVRAIRNKGEQLMRDFGAQLVRINPRHHEAPEGAVAVRDGALAALRRLDAIMAASS